VGEGVYIGVVTVNLPGRTLRASIDGRDHLAVGGRDGPSMVVGAWVEIPRGGTEELVVRFRLPPDDRVLRIEPSARIPAITWTAWNHTWEDTRPRYVAW
jgi:hypothetical protein